MSARDDYDPMGFYVEDLARDECDRMFDEIDRLRGGADIEGGSERVGMADCAPTR